MRDLISSILNIFKYIGRGFSFFRNIFFNSIFLILLAILFLPFFTGEDVTIESNSALLLTISGDIVEERQEPDPFSPLLSDTFGISTLPEETLLQDILDTIETAAEDSRINSIILDLSKMGNSSLNQLLDIGEALVTFKMTGKLVIAAEDFYTQNKYFLATYADKIFLNPMGAVDLHGFGIYQLHFKEALEKLKVNYHIFRVGTYKSATEPFTRSSMSPEVKIQNSQWLNALWLEFTQNIIEKRKLTPGTIDTYTNNISSALAQSDGDTAQLAVDMNLVDGLRSREELRIYFSALTGESAHDDFRYVHFKDYLKNVKRSFFIDDDRDAVGIIVAQGNIVPGNQPPGIIGGESLVKLIHQARQDEKVRALVLRIDSGGGSVFASEMIRRELQELRNSGKPLVVSMGSMAASGGYWIAAEADEIWAYPTTLTGSIGIFGAIPTFENSLAHLGVYSDGVGTTNLSAGLNLTQPLAPELIDAVQLSINNGYRKFVSIVAKGRKLDAATLAQVTEGQVFDGITAKRLNLVDKLGNLENAVEAAAGLAELVDYGTRYIRIPPSLSDQVLDQVYRRINIALTKSQLPLVLRDTLHPYFESLKTLTFLNDPRSIYAHCMINSF